MYRAEFNSEDCLSNATLNYSDTWGKHKFGANVSGEYNQQYRTGFWVQAKGITTNDFSYNNIGATSSRPFGGTGSSYEDPSLASLMGNVSYTYDNRYTLSATLRSDGSSMVGKDNTWGIFPSISGTWDVHREKFMSRAKQVTLLRLRAGHGSSGNLGGISSYTTLNTVKENGIVSVNGVPTVTLGAMKNTNPNLKWETRTTSNVGVDFGMWMFGKRLDISKALKVGENEIELVLTVGNRNLLGAFHTPEQENFSVGPYTWERSGTWTNGKSTRVVDSYALVKTLV